MKDRGDSIPKPDALRWRLFNPCALTAHAIHGRTTHVHAVISAETAPERILSDCKAYATRAFRRAFPITPRRRYWADHGSTRYLWNEVSLRAAVEYVLHAQGERMACYPDCEEA
jgi:hypothetical protein